MHDKNSLEDSIPDPLDIMNAARSSSIVAHCQNMRKPIMSRASTLEGTCRLHAVALHVLRACVSWMEARAKRRIEAIRILFGLSKVRHQCERENLWSASSGVDKTEFVAIALNPESWLKWAEATRVQVASSWCRMA